MKSKFNIFSIYISSVVLFSTAYIHGDFISAILIFFICIFPLLIVNFVNTDLISIANDYLDNRFIYFSLITILPLLSILIFIINIKDFKILALSSFISLVIINFSYFIKPQYFQANLNKLPKNL